MSQPMTRPMTGHPSARRSAPRVLRTPELLDRVGLGRSTVYRLIAEGTFPRPVQLTGGTVGWIEAEVADWLAARPRADIGGAGS